MKLLTKTTLIYIFVTLFLFLIGGVIFYFQLKSMVDEEITENLYIAKQNVENYVKINHRIPENQFLFGGKFSLNNNAQKKEILCDTLIYNENEDEYLPYKELIFPLKNDSISATVCISFPMFESDDLIQAISTTLIIISILLIIILLIVSGFISFRLWKPFFDTLNIISRYQVNNKSPLVLPKVKTKEFSKLNNVINEMTLKIEENFSQLRSFTENASHEIQTPLTAIRIETEQLLQNEKISESEMKLIHHIYNSALRLGKINESLLLLAKIGNDQFPQSDTVLSTLLLEKLDSFQDRIMLKNLQLKKEIEKNVTVRSSAVLEGILLSNLLSNAIRHNVEGGSINVKLTKENLEISNTGNPLPFDEDKLFQKFVRNIEKPDSSGLGLALVKEIAEKNNWKIHYHFEQGLHTFILTF
jgi:signal transduction histidine kinase